MTPFDERGRTPGRTGVGSSRAAADPWLDGGATASAAPAAAQPEPGAQTWRHVVLDNFAEGLLICDSDGVVLERSEVAARLLPQLAVGERMAGRVDGLASAAPTVEVAEFSAAGRRLRARRVVLAADLIGWYVSDVTDEVARAEVLTAERARSTFLASAGQALAGPLHVARTARTVVQLAVPTLADVAVLVLAPRNGRVRWWRAASRHAPGARPAAESSGSPVGLLPPALLEALAGGQPHSADWLAHQLVESGWLPGIDPSVSSCRIVALPGSGQPSGALVVAHQAGRSAGPRDDDLLRDFAERAGAAVNAALLYQEQADVAETLQSSLLPEAPPPVAGIQWGTAYRPAQAALRIGGDFYGAYPLSDGGALFVLGDVSGKGVEAAVFTGQLRQSLQALHRVEAQPARLLGLLNDAVLGTVRGQDRGRFATVVLGVARPSRDGGLDVCVAGGGHLPPLVLRRDGTVEPVALRGMLIGVVAQPRIGQTGFHLAPGESCLLYSDGVTEARGGPHGDQEYGADRLATALSGCHRMPAAALAERVAQITCDWLGDRDHDDIAVLALRADPAGGSRGTGRHLHAVPDLGHDSRSPQDGPAADREEPTR